MTGKCAWLRPPNDPDDPLSERIADIFGANFASGVYTAGVWWLFDPAWYWLMLVFAVVHTGAISICLEECEKNIAARRAARENPIAHPPSA